MKENDIRFIKLLILVNGAVPLALLVWDQSHHRLGANPQNFLILTTGMMTLIFLMLTMAVTPLRKITGWNWLIQFRRMLGLYAFFYGCLHFLCFFSLDRGFSVSSTLTEMVKRKYLIVGSTALAGHDAAGHHLDQRDDQAAGRQTLAGAAPAGLRGRHLPV